MYYKRTYDNCRLRGKILKYRETLNLTAHRILLIKFSFLPLFYIYVDTYVLMHVMIIQFCPFLISTTKAFSHVIKIYSKCNF